MLAASIAVVILFLLVVALSNARDSERKLARKLQEKVVENAALLWVIENPDKDIPDYVRELTDPDAERALGPGPLRRWWPSARLPIPDRSGVVYSAIYGLISAATIVGVFALIVGIGFVIRAIA